MQTEELSIVAIITVVLGLFSLLNQLITSAIARRNERRNRAVELFRHYYSPSHYRAVLNPVYRLILRIRFLEEPLRQEYQDAVQRGWSDMDRFGAAQLADLNVGTSEAGDAALMHYEETVDASTHSEHESLTVFMYFWLNLSEMLREGLVDKKVAIRLLRHAYPYFSETAQLLFSEQNQTETSFRIWRNANMYLANLFRSV